MMRGGDGVRGPHYSKMPHDFKLSIDRYRSLGAGLHVFDRVKKTLNHTLTDILGMSDSPPRYCSIRIVVNCVQRNSPILMILY